MNIGLRWSAGVLGVVACCSIAWSSPPAPAGGHSPHAFIEVLEHPANVPLVLDQEAAYVLKNVSVTGVQDGAAVTLAGRLLSVEMRNCRFGEVYAGMEGRAAAIEAAGAVVPVFIATGCYFFDAENQLVSFREGSFGSVTFERCTFRTSDSFLQRIYASSPWRLNPPVIEFYNIERLELLDNEYANTTVIIHPSVRQVILRGNLAGVLVENPRQTEVIYLDEDLPHAAGPEVHAQADAPHPLTSALRQWLRALWDEKPIEPVDEG